MTGKAAELPRGVALWQRQQLPRSHLELWELTISRCKSLTPFYGPLLYLHLRVLMPRSLLEGVFCQWWDSKVQPLGTVVLLVVGRELLSAACSHIHVRSAWADTNERTHSPASHMQR